MKTIKSSKDITTLEVGDVVLFGDLEYTTSQSTFNDHYFLSIGSPMDNGKIFKVLNINKGEFINKLGISADIDCYFPEVKSLEALTAIVSALFKEYEKQNELPKTWKEFCKKNPLKEEECFVNHTSGIQILPKNGYRDINCDKNLCTSKQEAKAFLALMQLRQLRKAYVKDWEPNWTSKQIVYSVGYNYILNKCVIESSYIYGNCMSFPTRELAEQFLTNFKDLLEIAKPLL